MMAQQIKGCIVKMDRMASFGLCLMIGEMVDQFDNVLAAVAQCRDINGDDVQAVKQVFTEIAQTNFLGKVAVGRGNYADIGRCGMFAPDRAIVAVFKEVQKLRLQRQRQFADFIQKQTAAIGKTDKAGAFLMRTGVGALFGAKQFAFDQLFRQGGTVDFDKGVGSTRALAVNGTRNQRLAGPGLPLQQDAAGTALCDTVDRCAQFAHRRAFANQTVGRDIALAVVIKLKCGAVLIKGGVDRVDQLIKFERLAKVIGRTEFDGLHRCTRVTMGRNHDDGHVDIKFADAIKDLHAIGTGQAQIKQDDIELVFTDLQKRIFTGMDAGDIHAFGTKRKA